jgi:hypothetical protein
MFRPLRILSLCAAALLGVPEQSQAGCLDWLFGCRSCNYCDPCCGGGVTTYRPIFPRLGFRRAAYGGDCCNTCYSPCASPCNSCVQYVPQTSYRACCVSVPVTTCRPVTACDPCTGCPVTVMRPVTTCVQQVRYTPVVTYRPVCPTTCCSPCCNPCGGCGTAACSPCNSCSHGGYGAASYSVGSPCCSGTTTLAPAATVVPGATVAPAIPAVVPSTTPVIPNGTVVPQTYQNGASYYQGAPAVPYDYNRNYNTKYRGSEPVKTLAPLTTEAPQRSWTFRAVSAVSESSDAGGWRAAKR